MGRHLDRLRAVAAERFRAHVEGEAHDRFLSRELLSSWLLDDVKETVLSDPELQVADGAAVVELLAEDPGTLFEDADTDEDVCESLREVVLRTMASRIEGPLRGLVGEIVAVRNARMGPVDILHALAGASKAFSRAEAVFGTTHSILAPARKALRSRLREAVVFGKSQGFVHAVRGVADLLSFDLPRQDKRFAAPTDDLRRLSEIQCWAKESPRPFAEAAKAAADDFDSVFPAA